MPASERHTLDNRTLAYCWSHGATAQPLVVIHGLGDSAIHTYAPRFATTSLQHTPSLFIDLPGFGESSASEDFSSTIEAMASDVAALLTRLDVRGAPLFAHSMGANIAIELGTRQPTLLRQVILAEPLLDPDQSILAAGIARYSENAFIARGYEMLVRATSLQAHRGETAAVAFLPTLRMASPRALHRAAVSLLQGRDPGFVALLNQLPHPVTLLFGQHSQADLPAMQREDVHVHRIEGAGHFMMAEAAEPTACAILGAVNGVNYEENRR